MSVGLADLNFKFINQSAEILGYGSATGRSASGIRNTTSSVKGYIDGILVNTNSTADSGSVPTIKFVSGGLADSDTTQLEYSELYSQTEIFGGGATALTDTELTNIYNAAANYNSLLGR